jgi:hypothetical protein
MFNPSDCVTRSRQLAICDCLFEALDGYTKNNRGGTDEGSLAMILGS